MKQCMAILLLAGAVFSCNNPTEKKTEETTQVSPAAEVAAPAIDLPFKATYSSNFTTNVSDADLKTVMDSYVYWRNGELDKLSAVMGDTTTLEMADGSVKTLGNNELKSLWKAHRDSLTSVDISMEAWQRLHSDKGEDFILTWYTEKDTYKTGKVDSANYHDINMVKNGKIVLYSTYKRPKKQ